jgi:L,D-transpeptidase YcbB
MVRIKLKYLTLIAAAFLAFTGCDGAETTGADAAIRDSQNSSSSSYAKADFYSDLYLDSAKVKAFIEQHKVTGDKAENLVDFYQSRNYQFAWFTSKGLDEHGRAFWNLHNNFLDYSRDSTLYNKELHQKMEVLLNDEEEANFDEHQTRELELSLTGHFFDYAKYAFTGSVDPQDLKWHIPRKKINAVALLDSLVATNGNSLNEWEPVNQEYKQMRSALMGYYQLEKRGGWGKIEGDKKVYRQDDSSAVIQQIKERLRLTGEYTSQDNSAIYTPELKAAVMQAQHRFGLKQDGVIGPNTLREFNKPVSARIKQMLVNMERMRWMPEPKNRKRLVANIPEYKLHVYEGEQKQFDMPIVVGKAVHKTVVFNDELQHVVFSPYWNIPASIVRNEILPAMRRNPNYLAENNMEQTGTRNGLPVIRQKPGGDNSLGRVKFIFPNSYAIYFHDTPAKHLFDQNKRAFSHGCIRLAEPQHLASYLLKNKSGWSDSDITSAMYADNEKWVKVPEPISVAITYFTSWVDNEGRVHFRQDIYGHDETLAAKMFE